MQIKRVTMHDKKTWLDLSKEYDQYVREIVHNLQEWYEGTETDMSFHSYMDTKIKKGEAYMVIKMDANKCLGIIAYSKNHNRITFLGVSHDADYEQVGELLMDHALSKLNKRADIKMNVLKSNREYIKKEKDLLEKYGFIYEGDTLEINVPVEKMIKIK